MNECNRCGNCCKVLPIANNRKIDPDLRAYYLARGCTIEHGIILAQFPCPHLVYPDLTLGCEPKYTCNIQATKPQTCKDFDGRPISHGRKYFIPDGCTMVRKGKDNRR